MALTLTQFTEQLTSSGLMTADEVGAALAELVTGEAPVSPNDPQQVEAFARGLVKQKKLTAFQAQQLYAGRGKSLLMGNYVILDKLGQGGMGMVLKAQHRRMKRLVALKVLAPTIAKTQDLQARFQREVEAAARLSHPNIVAAYDADVAGETHFLVMEYVEGRDLSSRVKSDGPLPVSEALSCILQAARGLQYAHQQGIVHRDIKPANLLLDLQGNVKILDMGLARITGNAGVQAELTSTGAVMGTVDYMAPEQARNTKHADARSDIYSLGISLWYLLVGQPTFGGESLTERLLAHQSEPIPSLRAACPGVSESLDQIFRKMIAKQPAERFQSMEEVCAALEAELRGEARPTVSVPDATHAGNNPATIFAGLGASDVGGTSKATMATAPRRQVITPAQTATVSSANAIEQTLISADKAPALQPLPTKKGRRKAARPVPRNPTMLAVAIGIPVLGILMLGLYWGASSRSKPSADDRGEIKSTNTRGGGAKQKSGERNLLQEIDGPRDSLEGAWRIVNQELISPVMPFAQIALPSSLPADYRLSLEVTRRSEGGPLVIGLPFAKSRCVATLDASSGSRLVRLETRSSKPGNPATRLFSTSAGLPVGQKSLIVCEVRGETYELWLNGESLLRFSGNPSDLTTPAYWNLPDARRGFLGACLCEFHINRLTFEPLSSAPTP